MQRVATELEADQDMQAWMNDWMLDALVTIIEQNRTQIASLISDTVKTWDGRDTSRRVELSLGRDLQFIRVNGTLVGGLVGVLIYGLTTWAGY